MSKVTSKGMVEIAVDVMLRRDKAWLVNDGKYEVWIPVSMIDDYCEEKGEVSSIFIPEWLAKDKGLI